MLKLVIGNKNYSSWSLRAWLYLRESGVEFEEIRIPLFTEGWREELARYTPAARVPVLVDGDLSIWDSLAIFETVLETHPGAVGWPSDRAARARARSIAAEMHSGFLAIRNELPQNLRAPRALDIASLSEGCRNDIARVDSIWSECREAHGATGPWLFGDYSIADVMYAPVALRFATYSVPVSSPAQAYIDSTRQRASIREWTSAAAAETESLPFIDDLVAADKTPLIPG